MSQAGKYQIDIYDLTLCTSIITALAYRVWLQYFLHLSNKHSIDFYVRSVIKSSSCP